MRARDSACNSSCAVALQAPDTNTSLPPKLGNINCNKTRENMHHKNACRLSRIKEETECPTAFRTYRSPHWSILPHKASKLLWSSEVRRHITSFSEQPVASSVRRFLFLGNWCRADSSEKLVQIYQTTRRHIPEDNKLNKLYRLHPVACIISYGYGRQHNNKADFGWRQNSCWYVFYLI
jgi:hypothetical protein